MIDKTIHCLLHGLQKWHGDVVCDYCGRIWMYEDAPETCTCKKRLIPLENRQLVKAVKFTARAICPRCSGRILPWWAKPIRFLKKLFFKEVKDETQP